jgi:hypothetical protein
LLIHVAAHITQLFVNVVVKLTDIRFHGLNSLSGERAKGPSIHWDSGTGRTRCMAG